VTVSVSGGPGIDYWSYLLVDAILRQIPSPTALGQAAFSILREDMPSFYPRLPDFQAIRRKMDPAGRFLNDHLRNLFA
jgi:D-arabinono-1,4-lactone oxidase